MKQRRARKPAADTATDAPAEALAAPMPAEAAQPAKRRAPRKAKAEQPAAPDTDSGTEAGTESGADSLPEAEPAPPAKRRATRKPKANAVAPAEGEDEAAAPSAEEAAAPATAPRPRRAERQKVEPALLDRLVAAAQESLDADKAEDIVVLDVTGRADYADCLVIATALADRQMQAMASHLEDAFEKEGLKLRRDATQASPDWVLIDAGDLVVHLFKPEARTLYGLERMWGPDSPAATVDEEEDRTPLPDDGSVPEPGIEEDDDE